LLGSTKLVLETEDFRFIITSFCILDCLAESSNEVSRGFLRGSDHWVHISILTRRHQRLYTEAMHITHILAASAAAFAASGIWYSPKLFGEAGLSERYGKRGYYLRVVGELASEIATATFLALAISLLDIKTWLSGAALGTLVWAGIITPAIVGGMFWESKTWKWLGVALGGKLLTLVIAGAVLAGLSN
jgi:hypothetical protein